ncbi:nuclear RNA export factor 1 isoform X2 [Anabrus simplex]|uniref:nuclear RNA export factor 1 isoform X2 n=1 Tax=Anabrus simplex TaxID=316456 RepID=UPI0035A34408
MDIASSKSSSVNAGKSMKMSPGSHGSNSFLQEQKRSQNAPKPKKSAAFWKPVKITFMSDFSAETTAMMRSTIYWHKFVVLDGSIHDKNKVLKTVLNSAYVTEFIPVMICLEIILCFAHVSMLGLSVNDSFTSCINKRYDLATRTLDLSNFANDPDLVDTFYCPLWLATVFNQLLLIIKSLHKHITCLLINKNELSLIKAHFSDYLYGLTMIDLSENKFDSINCLSPLRPLKLRELVLDKNPLCAQYSSGENYIRDVKESLPTLKKLDGVVLGDLSMPCWHRNFVVCEEGTDFVDQFLEHYFTIFDSENRGYLLGFYHEEGCFSMSANYLGGQSTSSTARLTRYTMESRNLFKISDYSKSFKLISHGPEDIIATLCRLPRTEHDPTTFTVDLLHYNAGHIVLTVSGVFREPSMMKQAPVRYFNRTFVLVYLGDYQYQICNEILYISNATTKQAEDSFKCTRTSPSLVWIAVTKIEQLTDADRRKMVKCMTELTDMSPRWAKKCLEESKWKFREALQVFTELLKMDKIPADAFAKA